MGPLAGEHFNAANVSVKGGKVKLTVVNDGGLPVPVALTFIFEDEETKTVYWNAGIWESGGAYIYKDKFDKAIRAIVLGSDGIPEIAPEDNVFNVEGS